MPYATALRCRECARTYPLSPIAVCEWCFGPLEPTYDYAGITAALSRAEVVTGPPSMWRYAPLLPVAAEGRIDLGAGFTPLVRAERLGAALGLERLWVKNDTVNPTGSFKDRVVSVALTAARQFGYAVAACASTGNLANSVAAHAAAAGMPAYVLVPADLEPAKLAASAVYGATLVAVEGTYDDVNRLSAELVDCHPDWAFVNVNLRAFYAEGSRTLAFEVAEQLGWRAPDHVVVPVGSGSQLTRIHRGFAELAAVSLLEEVPKVRVSGAQAAGCAPVAQAFASGAAHVRPVRPSTIARSIAIGNPADGGYALDVVRETGGAVASVSDEEIVAGIRLLARTEGIFAETAGGVTIATLAKLAAAGVVEADELVVAYVTGNGLKTVDALAGSSSPMVTIPPRLDAFAELVGEAR